jgi:hypothetical protein
VKADSVATAIIMTRLALVSDFPAKRPTHRPMTSVTPVYDRPAERTKTAHTMSAGSLETPEKASLTSISPVIESAKMIKIATTSTLRASVTKSTIDVIMMIVKII